MPISQRRIAEGVIAVLVAAGALWFILTQELTAWDFRNNLWGPAHLLVQGQSPYRIQQIFGDGTNAIWMPVAIGAFSPLGWLPEATATNIWLLMNVGLTIILVWFVRPEDCSPTLRWMAVAWGMAGLFPPTITHHVLGQYGLLAVVLMQMVVRWRKHHSIILISLLIALSLAKPQLVILPLIGLLAITYRESGIPGAVRLLLAIVAAALVLTLPLWIASPNWIEGLMFSIERNHAWLHPSLLVLLAQDLGFSGFVIWGIAALLILGINIRLWQRLPPRRALNWSLALNLLVTPYVWSWDFVLLLPLIVSTLFDLRSAFARALLLLGYSLGWAASVYIRLETTGDDVLFWWLPWVTISYVLLAHYADKRLVASTLSAETR